MSSRGPRRGRGRGSYRGGSNGSHTKDQRNNHYHAGADVLAEANDGQLNADITERFGGRKPRNGGRRTFDPADGMDRLSCSPDIRRYMEKQDEIAKSASSDDWLAQSEIPSPSEICMAEDAKVVLPRNRIEKPWGNKQSYLKAHYKLLREDAITGLREAVEKYKKDPQRCDDNDIRIYEKVRVVGLTFTNKGVASRIQFRTRSLRKILWTASKRLTSGTLVAMTPSTDSFRTTCILATVAARPIQNLDTPTPEVDIIFADAYSHEVDPQREYIMIEAYQGYFEAYRHTLKALQKQAKEEFPLSEYVCGLDQNIDAPQYLKEQPFADLSPAAPEEMKERMQNVNILDHFPEIPNSSLDITQMTAMKEILTRKLAIIQGPPGTGKTHVSKIAIEILLRNRATDTPIIIACQTNHALDQLLEKINDFEQGYIRLGGRSTSSIVKQRALYEVRKSEVIGDITGSCFEGARRKLSSQIMTLKSLLEPVNGDLSPSHLSASILKDLGVLTSKQWQSLEQGAAQWITANDVTEDSMQMWIGRAVGPYIAPAPQDNFGFAEVEEDLEIEQQRELDAENGLVDQEDMEMLRGEFLALASGLAIGNISQTMQIEAARALNSTDDLYTIPEYLKGPVYILMQAEAKAIIRKRVCEAIRDYDKFAKEIQIGRWEKDHAYLQKAPIVGLTTTGLSKYRPLISALKPKIILIEEAAEVLEGPVSVACLESLQHLILVGDHRQLQATCSVKELEGEPYHLNISMFERLVRNEMPYKTLLRQRRMMPEFRELIGPSYPKLEDHPSVLDRTVPVFGMGKILSWFWTHGNHDCQDEQMSMQNEVEAEMVAKFYRHLIRNGVPRTSITILTFYNGQRKLILKKLKSEPETASIYNIVKTVDSYQGEENHIVILSLVRSNGHGKIGFLDINNRITVALSRAKFGFYLFGNRDFLGQYNEIWDHVAETMYQKRRSDEKMPLTCTVHKRTVWVQYPDDFDIYQGGCDQACGGVITPCGHECPLPCHPYSHENVVCRLSCSRRLVCGHRCSKKCHEKCDCACETFQVQNEDATEFVPDEVGGANEYAYPGRQHDESTQVPARPHTRDQDVREAAQPDGRHDVRLQVSDERAGRPNVQGPAKFTQAPAQQLSQLSITNDAHEPSSSVSNSEKPLQTSKPVRQPRGPGSQPGWHMKEESKSSAQCEPLPTNNSQSLQGNKATLPGRQGWENYNVDTVDHFSEWLDPEEVEWQKQQEQEINDDFW